MSFRITDDAGVSNQCSTSMTVSEKNTICALHDWRDSVFLYKNHNLECQQNFPENFNFHYADSAFCFDCFVLFGSNYEGTMDNVYLYKGAYHPQEILQGNFICL